MVTSIAVPQIHETIVTLVATSGASNAINFAHIAVFPLDELEEGDHVGTAKVVGRLQAGEEAAPRQPLEVVLADVLKSE